MEANTGVHECHGDDIGRRGFPFIWSSVVISMRKRGSEMVQSVYGCRVTKSPLRYGVPMRLRMPWSWASFLVKTCS